MGFVTSVACYLPMSWLFLPLGKEWNCNLHPNIHHGYQDCLTLYWNEGASCSQQPWTAGAIIPSLHLVRDVMRQQSWSSSLNVYTTAELLLLHHLSGEPENAVGNLAPSSVELLQSQNLNLLLSYSWCSSFHSWWFSWGKSQIPKLPLRQKPQTPEHWGHFTNSPTRRRNYTEKTLPSLFCLFLSVPRDWGDE
jgi:hypothetical protein